MNVASQGENLMLIARLISLALVALLLVLVLTFYVKPAFDNATNAVSLAMVHGRTQNGS